MNGFVLLLPLLLIRYGLPPLFHKDALKRAAFFPPMEGNERIAFWIYQLATVLIFVCLCFLHVKTTGAWFYAGLITYGMGALLFAAATAHFASPSTQGVNRNGLYRLSRNPMYVAYFIFFLGCVMLTQSLAFLVLVIAFQVSSHWVILAEERCCAANLGDEYLEYAKRVRRYI